MVKEKPEVQDTMRLSSPQRALRGPGESYSEVILRLTAEEEQGLSRGAER
jgi:hypothetical protein